MIITQKNNGKDWENRIISRVIKMTIYIPKGSIDATKIHRIDKDTLRKYVETEGYGR
jgi:hypothetical protein